MSCLKAYASVLVFITTWGPVSASSATARDSSSYDSAGLVQISSIATEEKDASIMGLQNGFNNFDVIDWVWSILLIGTWAYLAYYCITSVLAFRSMVSFYSKGMSRGNMIFKLAGSIAPIVYVFSLPWLSKVGFANGSIDADDIGQSVSRYICTPIATGAFAGAIFYPFKEFWQPYQKGDRFAFGYKSVILTHAAFFLFLISPVVTYPKLHAIATLAFGLACLSHVKHVQDNLPESLGDGHLSVLKTLLRCGFVIFLCLLGCVTYQSCRFVQLLEPEAYPALGKLFPNLYYYLEALGLTCLFLWSAFRDLLKDVNLLTEEEKKSAEEAAAAGEGEEVDSWFTIVLRIIKYVLVATVCAGLAFVLLIMCAIAYGASKG